MKPLCKLNFWYLEHLKKKLGGCIKNLLRFKIYYYNFLKFLIEDTWSASAEQYVPREQSQSAKALISGRRLLHQTFVRARETSLTLLLLSSTKDAALFFRDNTDLFRSKIKTVVFSGEAKVPGHTDGDEAQFIEPDESSPNVAIDITSAQFLFRRLQEWGVPLIVLGQRAARAAPTPRSVFDQLAELGSPIGWRLQQ